MPTRYARGINSNVSLMNMNLRKGLIRVWILTSLIWLSFSAHHEWDDIEYSFQFMLQKEELDKGFAEYASQHRSYLQAERAELIAEDKVKLKKFAAEESSTYGQELKKLGLSLEAPDPNPRIKEIQTKIEHYSAENWHSSPPKYSWLAYMLFPPIFVLLGFVAAWRIGAWIYAGFKPNINI